MNKIVPIAYEDFPPYLYLENVLEHCPKAGFTYLQIWKKRNHENKFSIEKSKVREAFLMSLAKFRHDLLLLVKEGLINIDENKENIAIEMVSWDTDAEGYSLC